MNTNVKETDRKRDTAKKQSMAGRIAKPIANLISCSRTICHITARKTKMKSYNRVNRSAKNVHANL